ncbi:MAG: Sua5 family C-terminal domain-containing protein, partial [Flavobacteriaceae bacterium]|nr:Sua5 family C-terminal domain-containing protein [Flavobacteriaceae bacterium]
YNVNEVAFIGFKNKLNFIPTENQLVLSSDGNLNEAAQNLYHALHLMDDKNLKVIIAEKMPNEGIGKSINDRLTRASHNKKE